MLFNGLRTVKSIIGVVMWSSCVHLAGCATIGQAEYEAFKPMSVDARVMNLVKLSWEVRPDAGPYCQRMRRERGNLNAAEPIACAIWSVASKHCHIITGPNPNHVVLGHEVRHCFEGHFHP